ncbi:MAG: hypothetical protein ACXW4B_08670 [Micavibrio sp.]
MDSKLDSIFRTRFHPAEKSDTWLGIRRQDPQDDRPEKDRKDKEDDPEFGEDNTTLSVTALHGFLSTLLQQSGEAQTTPAPTPENPSAHAPAQPGYRAAASAYQTASQSGGPTLINRTDTPPPAASASPAITLSDDELQTIRRLLRDVEKLARYGGQMITLRPAATFLDSLALGVDEALDSAHP